MSTPVCVVIIMNAAICYHDRNDSRKSDLTSVFILVLAREGGGQNVALRARGGSSGESRWRLAPGG